MCHNNTSYFHKNRILILNYVIIKTDLVCLKIAKKKKKYFDFVD